VLTFIMQYLVELGIYLLAIVVAFYALDFVRAAVTRTILAPKLLHSVDQLMVDEEKDADNPLWDKLLAQAKKYDKWVGEKYCLEQIVAGGRKMRRTGVHKLAVFMQRRA
jgi:hypothetical protein